MSARYRGSDHQPPPTPGIFQWVVGSLLNKETPSHKYAHQQEQPQQEPALKTYRDQEKFATRKREQYFDDEAIRLKKYYKERELLPDFENDTFHKRSSSMGNLSSYKQEKIRLSHPGKFPSPYHKSKTQDIPSSPPILSSTSKKNFKLASINAKRNKNIVIDSSPIIIPSINKTKDYLKASSKHNDQDELEILELMDSNNRDLKQLSRSIESMKLHDRDVTSDTDYVKLQTKYKEVKSELIAELKKSQKLYDSYYRFVNKYKKLKEDKRGFNDDPVTEQKIKRLEEKLIKQQESNMDEKFSLTRKIDSLQTKLNDQQKSHELEIWKREQKIKDLEKKLELHDRLSDTPHFASVNSLSPQKENIAPVDDTLELINKKYPDKKSGNSFDF